MIRVLIVEDSAVVRELLVQILSAEPGIEVVGVVADGEEALVAAQRLRPDVITMDIHMPRMDGLEATRRIMERHPVPIVVVSASANRKETEITFRALEAGALAVIPRPAGIMDPEHDVTARELARTVKLMSEVPVVRRWPRSGRVHRPEGRPAGPVVPRPIRVVAIGASTGGPPALRRILSELPGDFPAPVLIVQHMATGFIEAFAEWLARSTQLRVHLARDGEPVRAGEVYVAPDAFHMKVDVSHRIVLTPNGEDAIHRPAVSELFRSIAEVYGQDVVAGLLTGMGRDGADDLGHLRRLGAITFAQDKATSVVHGMPGEAIRLGAVLHVLPVEQIARTLAEITRGRK